MVRVKICGITNIEDALAACDAGADALGFVFAEEAKARQRYISPGEARRIIEALPPFVDSVAVCVNESPARLSEYLAFADYVQLCGQEPVETYAAIGARAVKVFHAGPGFELAQLAGCPAAGCLLDASVPGVHGGTGLACDWDVARRAAELCNRIILAGGLTPENVAEAVRLVRPYGVDVSGGVEQSPGRKDHERVRRFIQNARLSVS